jgi:hypothetical protein
MRRILILVGTMLFLSGSASAQGPAGAGAGVGSRPSSRSGSGADVTPWQLALGYQYNLINLTGNAYNTNGINASLTRFFGNWIGIEGQVGAGFGNTGTTTTPANLNSKWLYAGAGPHLAFRGHGRIEPWIHATGGLLHFQFTQTAGGLGNQTSLAGEAGVGVDFRITPSISVRGEGDFIESRFFSSHQRHFQTVGGFVFNF